MELIRIIGALLWAIVRYFALLIGLAVVGALLIRLGASTIAQAQNWGSGAWIIAALTLSAVLSGVSLIFSGIEDADGISHYSGTAVGNSVSLSAVTNGESAWKWRTGLIFIFMICTEMWFQGQLGSMLHDLGQAIGSLF